MNITSKFENTRVLVVGDVMLDRYWWGDVTRISPEAPVPIVRLNRTTLAAGGAANVAANIAGLGATPLLLGSVGADPESAELKHVIADANISIAELLVFESRRTTVKTRVIAHSQQVARVDQESDGILSDEACDEVFSSFQRLAESAGAVAVSDYAKGFLPESLVCKFIAHAVEIGLPIVVDPKGRDYSRYKGATVITPNRREAALACNVDEGKATAEMAGRRLLDDLALQAVLITEGEDGMTLFMPNKEPAHFAASAREVYDVTGAGDTVLASIAASLAAGLGLQQASHIANIAAGLVVEKVGTAVVSFDKLLDELSADSSQAFQ